MLVCEEINFELPPKIIVLNPKDGLLIWMFSRKETKRLTRITYTSIIPVFRS